ncbi:MAG: class III lanthionine synthetase LanKC [Lachnospiraceae bacterium]
MDTMEKIVAYLKYTSEEGMYYEKLPVVAEEEYTVKEINEKWEVMKDDPIWTYYHIPNILLPMQGWKIHISVSLDEAEEILQCVSKILISLEIPFKHIRSKRSLRDMFSKNGNRVSSGKFITIYPQGEEFIELIEILERNLLNFRPGPYILTDKQWKDTNIYFRYGAFKKMLSPSGELCLIDANGNLTPDLRKPQYYVPAFVKVPKKLVEADSPANGKEQKENKLKQYQINKAFRFSNSGGIYIGNRISDGLKCVIKEARSDIGFDAVSHSAGQRLENEFVSLNKLSNIPGIVKVIDFFKVWKNTFLVEEFVEGIELAQWIAGNYPFSPNDDIQVYFNKIVKIMDQLKDIIYQMHNAGIAMCDLQTRNILVDETLNVTLIDFEIATDSDSESPTGMATKGYTHKLNKIASEKDWYSLNRILQFSLLPIGAVTDIDMNLNAVHCFWIRNNFGQTAYNYFIKYQTECCNHLSNKKEIFKETYSGCKETKVFFEQDIPNTIRNIFEKVTEGLLENCQIDRDSLINGDIRQFEMNCGKLNIFTGGYGAVLALSRNNALPDNINTWIDNNMEDLCMSNYNNGFLSGRSGIAATLYECGYIDESLKLVNSIVSDYSIETLDLSLRSGLSGIGLMLIAFYAETQTYKYKSEAINIADYMMQKISSNEKLTMTDWDSVDVGLIDGYSGFALFYTLLYKISEEESYLQFAHELSLCQVIVGTFPIIFLT